MANRFNKCAAGVVFLDLIFAILPIILIVVYTLTHAAYLSDNGTKNLEAQVVFHKLVSVSDVVVKQIASEKSGGGWDAKSEPNLVSAEGVAAIDTNALRDKLGLKSLSIRLSDESGTKIQSSICIYRIVVAGEFREIKKLLICGA